MKRLVNDGSDVAENIPLIVLSYDGFAVRAALPKAKAYRYVSEPVSARAEITGGPGPTDCDLLTAEPGGDGITTLCALPMSYTGFAGLPALVALVARVRHGVVILPVSAVAGRSRHGEVEVVDDDGTHHIETVKLGITDGSNIEIRDGVDSGDRVAAVAPRLSPSSS